MGICTMDKNLDTVSKERKVKFSQKLGMHLTQVRPAKIKNTNGNAVENIRKGSLLHC